MPVADIVQNPCAMSKFGGRNIAEPGKVVETRHRRRATNVITKGVSMAQDDNDAYKAGRSGQSWNLALNWAGDPYYPEQITLRWIDQQLSPFQYVMIVAALIGSHLFSRRMDQRIADWYSALGISRERGTTAVEDAKAVYAEKQQERVKEKDRKFLRGRKAGLAWAALVAAGLAVTGVPAGGVLAGFVVGGLVGWMVSGWSLPWRN